VGGLESPWIAGEWLFMVTNDAQVIAMTRDAGRVRWITQLQKNEDPNDRKSEPVVWRGPIVAGGRLILANNLGEMLEVSVEDGKIIKKTKLPGPVRLAPIVAGNMLYVLTDDGDLIAYH
jgi:outer membrane protein assembly factor BamB